MIEKTSCPPCPNAHRGQTDRSLPKDAKKICSVAVSCMPDFNEQVYDSTPYFGEFYPRIWSMKNRKEKSPVSER